MHAILPLFVFGSIGAVYMAALLVGVLLYFLPTVIAVVRGHDRSFIIFILNLLLGWTMIAVIILALWAIMGETRWMRDNAVLESRLAMRCR